MIRNQNIYIRRNINVFLFLNCIEKGYKLYATPAKIIEIWSEVKEIWSLQKNSGQKIQNPITLWVDKFKKKNILTINFNHLTLRFHQVSSKSLDPLQLLIFRKWINPKKDLSGLKQYILYKFQKTYDLNLNFRYSPLKFGPIVAEFNFISESKTRAI